MRLRQAARKVYFGFFIAKSEMFKYEFLYNCINMYKLLADSDALIKISKAEFLDFVVENFQVLITGEVYKETVNEGKRGFYQDAYNIERLIKINKIKVLEGKSYKKNKKPKQNFGKGEESIFQARKKGILIVTDDLSFTLYAQKENIKSISSAHLVFILAKKGKLKKDKAYYFLEKLRPFIRKEIYELVKNDIQGE